MDKDTYLIIEYKIKELRREKQTLLDGIKYIEDEKTKVINNRLHAFNDLFRSKNSENTKLNILNLLDEKIAEKNKQIGNIVEEIKNNENTEGYAEMKLKYPETPFFGRMGGAKKTKTLRKKNTRRRTRRQKRH